MPSETFIDTTLLPFETAAQLATLEPLAAPGQTAGEVRHALTTRRYESVSHIVVCEGRRFLGLVRIENLLAAGDATVLTELMDDQAPVVAPGVDQEVAAWRAVSNQESALTVVDREGDLVGLIPPHRLLEVLLAEHEEDLSRLGGFIKSAAMARISSEEPVERRFRHRLPWLW